MYQRKTGYRGNLSDEERGGETQRTLALHSPTAAGTSKDEHTKKEKKYIFTQLSQVNHTTSGRNL
ncbi:hypothetical protein pdam_00009655 [Pocillopora damicornis]|uniref:Uncharacterized protein n=1 Tax=Pocillopora damicornis TaxID=46731 RepID=A0A3M6UAN0_POCDA|nr:hypothetical protein pdam_00009655 [Pocillopora damicornis]